MMEDEAQVCLLIKVTKCRCLFGGGSHLHSMILSTRYGSSVGTPAKHSLDTCRPRDKLNLECFLFRPAGNLHFVSTSFVNWIIFGHKLPYCVLALLSGGSAARESPLSHNTSCGAYSTILGRAGAPGGATFFFSYLHFHSNDSCN